LLIAPYAPPLARVSDALPTGFEPQARRPNDSFAACVTDAKSGGSASETRASLVALRPCGRPGLYAPFSPFGFWLLPPLESSSARAAL